MVIFSTLFSSSVQIPAVENILFYCKLWNIRDVFNVGSKISMTASVLKWIKRNKKEHNLMRQIALYFLVSLNSVLF